MLATKFEKVFTQETCISFQNIIIEIAENMLFFAAFLGKPLKVNTALKCAYLHFSLLSLTFKLKKIRFFKDKYVYYKKYEFVIISLNSFKLHTT